MSRYNKNAVHRSIRSLQDMQYLGVWLGYNVFQQNNAEGYSAIKADDRDERVDGLGSIAEITDWIGARNFLSSAEKPPVKVMENLSDWVANDKAAHAV